jgi:glycosyltransferase involved in cell wall biosynthesis
LGWTAASASSPFAGSTPRPSRSQEARLLSHASPLLLASAAGRAVDSVGIVSTFPPTACGIATFAAALADGLASNGTTVKGVHCGSPLTPANPLVHGSLGTDDPGRLADALEVLNRTDVVIVQHEYGIFGGVDGDAVLPLLAGLRVPTVLVAHTVLRQPSANQRLVLEQACGLADAIVVMTESGRSRLVEGFAIEPGKISLIAHGAATPPPHREAERARARRPRLLTWGLLGPGKGIEWAIDALARLTDLRPRPEYLIAGATHPKVLASSGESYREMLIRRAWTSGAAPQVSFDDAYRDLGALTELIRSADLVVLPYDSDDQVTSGVLVDAVAAGVPVVATAFPHAVELLSSGAGLVVPQRDPDALALAIRAVLSDPSLAASMAAEARDLAPGLAWPAVAGQYAALAGRLLGAEERAPA